MPNTGQGGDRKSTDMMSVDNLSDLVTSCNQVMPKPAGSRGYGKKVELHDVTPLSDLKINI